MKIKCVREECPICHNTGSIQLFMNKKGEVRYARTRHYRYLDKDSKKPQFSYCKINDLDSLKTLLSDKLITLSKDTAPGQVGQFGQVKGFVNLDHQRGGCATKQQNKAWASSSVRIGQSTAKGGFPLTFELFTDRAPAS